MESAADTMQVRTAEDKPAKFASWQLWDVCASRLPNRRD